jgi:Recombination endonuclease VII
VNDHPQLWDAGPVRMTRRRHRDPEKRAAAYRAWAARNREKRIATSRLWRARNPEKQRASDWVHKLRQHGLTPERHGRIVADQQGRCRLCGRDDFALQIDHDHRCCDGPYGCEKCVRGLLCGPCNRPLGTIEKARDAGLITITDSALAAYLDGRAVA